MIRLLRRFSAYRALESELADTASRLIQSQDEVRLWRAMHEKADAALAEKGLSLEKALKQNANFFAVQSGSINVPFPEVWVSPPVQESDPEAAPPNMRERISPREMETRARAKSRSAMFDHMQARQAPQEVAG